MRNACEILRNKTEVFSFLGEISLKVLFKSFPFICLLLDKSLDLNVRLQPYFQPPSPAPAPDAQAYAIVVTLWCHNSPGLGPTHASAVISPPCSFMSRFQSQHHTHAQVLSYCKTAWASKGQSSKLFSHWIWGKSHLPVSHFSLTCGWGEASWSLIFAY